MISVKISTSDYDLRSHSFDLSNFFLEMSGEVIEISHWLKAVEGKYNSSSLLFTHKHT